MQDFVITLLICSVGMSVVALLYMLAKPLVFRRYSAKWGYYIWLIVFVGLLIPFRPQAEAAVVNVTTTPPAMVNFAREATVFFTTYERLVNISATNEGIIIAPDIWSFSIWHVVFVLWLAGAVAFLAYHCIRHFLFMKTVKRWSEKITDGEIVSLFESIKREVGVGRDIPLYTCPFAGPMMIGILNPKIFLPEADLSLDELAFILKHELVHYKRLDLLFKYLMTAARAMHWFNPVVHFAAKAAYALCEETCDIEVVQNADAETRQAYSAALIGVVKHQSKAVFSANFNRGMKGMKSRISAVTDMRPKKPGTVIAGAIVALIAGTIFLFSTAPDVLYEAFAAIPSDVRFTVHDNAELDNFAVIHGGNHGLLWDMPESSRQLLITVDLPVYNVSLIQFFHYHDHVRNEDVFVRTDMLHISGIVYPGEAILVYNFEPPDFVPWSIIAFTDDSGWRYFVIGSEYMLEITSQMRFE